MGSTPLSREEMSEDERKEDKVARMEFKCRTGARQWWVWHGATLNVSPKGRSRHPFASLTHRYGSVAAFINIISILASVSFLIRIDSCCPLAVSS